jgi:hypothetical protein
MLAPGLGSHVAEGQRAKLVAAAAALSRLATRGKRRAYGLR